MKNAMDLSGVWRFALDPQGVGTNYCGGWYQRDLPDTVTLPGDIMSNKKGIRNLVDDWDSAGAPYSYVGPAWYQTDILIPEEWADKSISLYLEHTARTRVWVDEISVGSCDSIQTSQTYSLGAAAYPGKHRLTICVNNAPVRPLLYGAHCDNGICGVIELRAQDKVHITRTAITPLPDIHRARVEITVVNETGIPVHGKLYTDITCRDGIHNVRPKAVDFLVEGTKKTIWFEQYMGESFAEWNEFTPNIYDVAVRLTATCHFGSYADEDHALFGMRSFTQHDMQLFNNSRAVFLRGDCAGFARSSYDSHLMQYDVDWWRQMMKGYQEYGINHLRFHTHVPPEACLYAADECGMYIQMELTMWANIPYPEQPEWDAMLEPALIRHGQNILRRYANHPSFVMFSLGNELEGNHHLLGRVVEALRAFDPTRLYAQGTNNNLNDPFPLETDDFFISNKTAAGHKMIRASCAHADYPVGKLQNEDAPDSYRGYGDALEGYSVPMIGHEIGQYETSPNFDDIDEFSDEWKPKNLRMFKDLMAQKGLLYKEKDFFRATGQLAVLCYREDMEMYFRTPGMNGFQMLALNDCLGQGSSIVGMRNAVGHSKGIVETSRWRCWCNHTVLLLGLDKYVYTAGEPANYELKAANFGPADITSPIHVTVSAEGRILSETTFTGTAAQGERHVYGKGTIDTSSTTVPERYDIRIALEGSEIYNLYQIWVFPAVCAEAVPAQIVTEVNDETLARLAKGERLLLLPSYVNPDRCVEGHFASNFWSYSMFANMSLQKGVEVSPGTLGLCMDPAAPALSGFPTEEGTNWQWWRLIMQSRPVILTDLPELEPILWMVDNPMRSEKMGLIFEGKIGAGSLLISSIDLLGLREKHPEAAALLQSLLTYLNSDAFAPAVSLTEEDLKAIF